MENRECLTRINYEDVHKLLNLRDDIKIESIFITDNDNMSNRITIKLSPGPCSRPKGDPMYSLSPYGLEQLQNEETK